MRLCRHAAQGSLSCGADILPVHAPVQPAWSTIGAVMSWSEAWGLKMPLHGCVVTLRKASRRERGQSACSCPCTASMVNYRGCDVMV